MSFTKNTTFNGNASSHDVIPTSCDDEFAQFFSDPSIAVQVLIIISLTIDAVIVSCGSIMNLLVLVVLWKRPTLQTNSNILLGFLAISDFVVGVVLVPCDMYRKFLYLRREFDCKFEDTFYIPQIYFVGLSLCTVVLITLDRYIALFFPFWYKAKVDKKLLFSLVSVFWIFWFVFQIPYIVILYRSPEGESFLQYVGYFITLSFFVALFFVTFAYARIYRLSRRHVRQISSHVFISEDDRNATREAKAAKTSSTVVVFLFICYSPSMISMFIFYILKCPCLPRQIFNPIVLPCSETAVFLNSFINPLLYWFRIPQLKAAMKETLGMAV